MLIAAPDKGANAAQRIVAPSPEIGVSVPNRFGRATAASGEWLLVGALGEDEASAANAGDAHAYRFGGSVFVLVSRLNAVDAGSHDEFGRVLAIDGDVAIIGAHAGDGCQQGSARLFLGSASGWRYVRPIPIADAAPHDLSGYSVALVEAGPIVGAPESNNPVSGADATGSVILAELRLSLLRDDFDPNSPRTPCDRQRLRGPTMEMS